MSLPLRQHAAIDSGVITATSRYVGIDTVLMGRKTFEMSRRMGGSSGYPGVTTYVFSRTLKHEPDRNVAIVSEDAADFVRQLKDQPGKDRVVVLTHRLWQRRFGGETNIVGRTIQLSEQSYTVIGVLPPRFLPRAKAEFVIPGAIAPKDANQRAAHWLDVFGRLKPGVTVEQARSEVNAVAARLRALYPAQKKDWSVAVVPMQEGLTRDFKSALLMLLGAVGFVLLIACTNVANLLLARASARQQETAIRAALGASRWQIIRHPSQKDWGASVQPLNEQIVGGWGARSAGRRNLQDERDGILGPHVRSDRFGRNGLANDCAACATECHARGFAGARDDRHAVRVGREANAGLAHRIRIESNAFS